MYVLKTVGPSGFNKKTGPAPRDKYPCEKFPVFASSQEAPETVLNGRALSTALCMQIFSFIAARRRDFEALLVFEFLLPHQR